MRNFLILILYIPSIVLGFNPYRKLKVSSDADVDNYLRKYGYSLDTEAASSDVFASNVARTAGIRFFQRFNHLPVTGKLDNATLNLMNTPRCGCPDIISSESKSPNTYALGTVWRSTTDLTWKIITPTNQLTLADQRAEMTRAFKVWSDVAGITFTETTGNANINILFAVGDHGNGDPFEQPFDGPGGVLAHAFFPEDGRTHFDEEETWVIQSNAGIDLFTVTAHEIGHAIGLDHSEVQSALMAPFYTGYNPNFALDSDDIAGARALYGPATLTTSAATTSMETTTTSTTTEATTTTTEPTTTTTEPTTSSSTTATTRASSEATSSMEATTLTSETTTSTPSEATSTSTAATTSSITSQSTSTMTSASGTTTLPPTAQTDAVVGSTTTSGGQTLVSCINNWMIMLFVFTYVTYVIQ